MIYVDHNATSPLHPAAIEAMKRGITQWGNPSSSHRVGREALALLEEAREQVATSAGVKPKDIVFTSGGSESNHLALMGSWLHAETPFHLLTTDLEHSSIVDMLPLLERQGARISRVRILRSGALDWADFEAKLTEKPHLVSIMAANNETGVVFPIPEIVDKCRALKIPVHTDAVQAFGKLDPRHWNGADLISLSAHKVRGPKGVGALITQHGIKLTATHYGGSQETKRRGGTQNLPGIAGFGAACAELRVYTGAVSEARDLFERSLLENLQSIEVLGSGEPRVPNTSCIRFEGIRSEILLSNLDMDGVCVSVGSACSSGSVAPSHVLLAMGLSEDAAREAVRFSWGSDVDATQVDTVARLVIKHVTRIRERRKESK